MNIDSGQSRREPFGLSSLGVKHAVASPLSVKWKFPSGIQAITDSVCLDLQLLAEKGELPTRFGSATLGILLLQVCGIF